MYGHCAGSILSFPGLWNANLASLSQGDGGERKNFGQAYLIFDQKKGRTIKRNFEREKLIITVISIWKSISEPNIDMLNFFSWDLCYFMFGYLSSGILVWFSLALSFPNVIAQGPHFHFLLFWTLFQVD